MTHGSPDVCPHCGKPIQSEERKNPELSTNPDRATEKTPDREYDHRGIPMPRRTRMGGIITPQ